MPTLVTGQLLGLDIGQTLEVTDCFPFPVSRACCCVRHHEACRGSRAPSRTGLARADLQCPMHAQSQNDEEEGERGRWRELPAGHDAVPARGERGQQHRRLVRCSSSSMQRLSPLASVMQAWSERLCWLLARFITLV